MYCAFSYRFSRCHSFSGHLATRTAGYWRWRKGRLAHVLNFFEVTVPLGKKKPMGGGCPCGRWENDEGK